MDVCMVDREGEVPVPRNMKAAPEACLKAVAPSRDGLVGAVDCLFTGYGLADRWAHEGLPCARGHALSMQAIPGGQAQHDAIDAQKIAALRRGGMLPQA
jgi:hypothetical protein